MEVDLWSCLELPGGNCPKIDSVSLFSLYFSSKYLLGSLGTLPLSNCGLKLSLLQYETVFFRIFRIYLSVCLKVSSHS